MIIVDSHCHLNFPEFQGKKQEDAVNNAISADVKYMQTICTKISEYEEVYGIAEKYENIFASVGIHPHEAGNESISKDKLIELTKRPKTIGIGETGLDYYYDNSPRKEQQKGFEEHISAAQEVQLPVIIHTRDAEDDTFEILNRRMKEKQFPALIHCFTASDEFARKCLDIGLYISISGIVTFKKATELQETVKNTIPLEKMLIETDSPFLAPVPYRGKTNQPAYTHNVAEFVAGLKDVEVEQVAETTTHNFFSLFNKAR